MKMPWTNQQGPMKLLVICATVLLISIGTCGLQAVVISLLLTNANFLESPLLFLGYLELLAMLLSIAGIVAALFWLLFKTIASSFTRRPRGTSLPLFQYLTEKQ